VTLIAHIADVHLGYAQYGLEEREEDIYQAFEEAIELVARERVEILLIAGDLFDSPKPPIKALIKARDLLKKLRDRGVEIVHVLGDHELPRRLSDLPPTAILEGISKHAGLKTIKTNNVIIVGLDRTPTSTLSSALNELKKLTYEIARSHEKKILLAHIPAHRPEKGIELLPIGYDYYALGHEHERKILSKNGVAAAYPGSMEILSTAEIESWMRNGKGFLLVDFSSFEPIIHEVNLKSIRPQKIVEAEVANLEKALEELDEWMKAFEKKPVVHVRVAGRALDRAAISRRIQEKLLGKALYYRHEILEEEIEEPEIETAKSLDLKSLIKEYMAAKGAGREEIELAAEIYDAFIAGGADEVEKVILKKIEEAEKR